MIWGDVKRELRLERNRCGCQLQQARTLALQSDYSGFVI
jgi:hypothetical protein